MYDEKIALASCVILIIAMIAMSAFAVTADQIEIIEKSESPVYYAPYWVRCPECEKSGLGSGKPITLIAWEEYTDPDAEYEINGQTHYHDYSHERYYCTCQNGHTFEVVSYMGGRCWCGWSPE